MENEGSSNVKISKTQINIKIRSSMCKNEKIKTKRTRKKRGTKKLNGRNINSPRVQQNKEYKYILNEGHGTSD